MVQIRIFICARLWPLFPFLLRGPPRNVRCFSASETLPRSPLRTAALPFERYGDTHPARLPPTATFHSHEISRAFASSARCRAQGRYCPGLARFGKRSARSLRRAFRRPLVLLPFRLWTLDFGLWTYLL